MFDGSLLERVRADFPALRREVGDRRVAYLDGPGGTQVPRPVIDAVAEYLAHRNANTHGAFVTSRETDAVLADARAALADFVGAVTPREIAFGANMTTLTYALSRSLAREWGAGDEIVVTRLDHQANVAPWRQAADERGVTVRVVDFDPETGELNLAQLEALLSARTRLVAVGAASNAIGTINDVPRIAALARAAGALCFVDAVHFAPHRRIEVQALGCDFLACSAYKFFGPHVGVLWGRAELLERFSPYRLPPAPDTVPERWETGTLNHEGIAGAAAAVEWINALGRGADASLPRPEALRRAMAAIEQHETALFARLADGLAAVRGVRLYGPPPGRPRTPTAAFTLAGQAPDAVAAHLAERGVFVWSGDFYAPGVVERLGLAASGGVVRAGLAVYSGTDDVERLLEALAELA